ncbi:MAG: glycosyl hydrolase-related protein, partial [Devosia sp.]
TLEAVKQSEAGDGIVLRLWETHGREGKAVLSLPEGTVRAELVNLLERSPQPLDIEDGKIALSFAPFQIMTIKLGA